MEKKKTGLGTAALVLGIVGIALSFIPVVNYVCYVLGLLALIFGIVSLAKKSAVVRSVIAVILAIASVAVAVVMQKSLVDSINDLADDLNSGLSQMTGEATEDILENYLDVTIGEFTYTDDEFLPETKLDVKVKNISSEKKSFDVMIEAVDQSGKRIDYDIIFVSELGAGQQQDFEAFILVDSDVAEKLKTASLNIVEASMY